MIAETFNKIINKSFETTDISPLITFRIFFGVTLFITILRFWINGWIEELYISPEYHFNFIPNIDFLPDIGIYIIFTILLILSISITFGAFYRTSTASFFLLFTYIELIDKTYYLNHYYLVSILTFYLIFLPANRAFSLDCYFNPLLKSNLCSKWHITLIKCQLSIVYFYAGLAKINKDWLIKAQPLYTWLPGKFSIPIIGKFTHLKITALLFSWVGCIYDLTIWLFLWIKKTRKYAFYAVIVFHIMTGILFPRIGMFPMIMIAATTIFLPLNFHKKCLELLSIKKHETKSERITSKKKKNVLFVYYLMVLFLGIQVLMPLRHHISSNNIYWDEIGYRFSWRVMLMEKNGYTNIVVIDPRKEIQYQLDQDLYLSKFQQQQMKSQPDMILQFVNYVGNEFKKINGYPPVINIHSRMSLNGRKSQPFFIDTVNVYKNNLDKFLHEFKS